MNCRKPVAGKPVFLTSNQRMSKENVVGFTPPRYSTTPHNVPRISQNFRVTKAFGDRKRLRDTNSHEHQFSSDSHLGAQTESSSLVSGFKRVPLSEISMNAPFKYHVSGCTKEGGEFGKVPNNGTEVVMRGEFNKEVATERVAGVCLQFDSESDAFVTPVKQTDFSNFSDGFMGSSLLDDDFFNESVLQEIDAMVERESLKKPGRPKHDISIDAKTTESDSGDGKGSFSSSGPLMVDENLRKEVALDPLECIKSKEENADNSLIIQSQSMPEEYSRYLQSLNERQREAACSDISIPLMIVAGPGSGKTSTMVGRVLKLLNEGICPSNILAMTFTTAAAGEMRDRVGAVAGKAIASKLMISTFHSFSLQLCRLHAEKLERTADFLIYGHGQQRRAIIEAVRLSENGKAGQDYEACKVGEESDGMRSAGDFKDKSGKWQKFVTQAKASGKTPSDFLKMGDEKGATVLQSYNDILRTCNALDYHDMISCSLKLLTDFPEVFEESMALWRAIIVDEFQDTSAMQYGLLRRLASHNNVTIVGDDDQSIFSFNGADSSGFDSFRTDFPNHKEIRLVRNYRSTRCIVEAAKCLIQNNVKRCSSKDFLSENSVGSKITVTECYNEVAQCAFVTDKILETVSGGGDASCSYNNIAVLYRRQVSGKLFQTTFRERRIPFNTHGVAFYRKKVVRAIVAMLRTVFPACDDGAYRKVFKALLSFEKDEKKKVIEHIEKVSAMRKCSFISAANDIFMAKVSGTFRRSQLTQGRKVLSTLDMIKKLIDREQSISSAITSVANMIPQKYLLEQRAVIDNDGGKLLNEDNDLRSVLRYLLDDVSDFLSSQHTNGDSETDVEERKGCANLIKSFIDYISEREKENFRSRRHDNEASVTLTTIHQSKGLEWDIVFIIKANETEIPLLHDFDGASSNGGISIEEERRLLYVAMTRARKKLYILYVTMDMNWQMLQPSRFLREIPHRLLETQTAQSSKDPKAMVQDALRDSDSPANNVSNEKQSSEVGTVINNYINEDLCNAAKEPTTEPFAACYGNVFLRRFAADERTIVSHLFHQWAKKAAFHNPKRLLDKVRFVIDERLRAKNYKHKEVLRSLKSCLSCDEALTYADYVVNWEKLPADQRAHIVREKQEHFQKLRMETSMGSSAATPKQISYLRTLGCTVSPTSRLHASRLIEHYKSL